ncbi:carboxypeptidase-like regulatory domain-containing protein [Hymenobacter properus]|uniref:Carboxypeptidase-like regulatory domain-containing protein n=1 Tax=Hymenobacter properus TaxID=2791026 RepID=A0A931BGQ1_9BACT|nr:carboxypeptidase-like regulatory domain-containing protein [Hymenobacter properus]MBF9143209.1 carboxypeptidase-like regulatory domain-containing protein [Hymenobacter properus]MBR7722018.1 carboxypeptidase-like regulatory domain-containing protein [Microvirga sp. SRT04]
MMSTLRCLLLGWLVLLVGQGWAQTTQVLRGQVLDAETHQPIPNAQVGVADNRIGTSTNADGRFALNVPPAYSQERLTVALIGYKNYSQPLPPLPGPELRIALKIAPAALGEVQVTGSVLGIVQEAVARIPQNYPVRPTRLEGFFRESDEELERSQYRYLGEAVLKVLKAPYTQPKDDGEIVIEQVRKVDLQSKTSFDNTGWYAGPFIPHRFDFVHNRLAFINANDFKNYDYKLADLTAYNDRPVYVIEFGPKPNNTRADFAGRLYIDQQSYAFLAAEWHRTPAGIKREYITFDSEERAYRTDYQFYAGRWHLKSVWYNTVGKTGGGVRLHHLSEFLTTAIDTAQRPAPRYTEKAQFQDVFRQTAVRYDSAFWKNYTTLLPPEQLRHALRDQARQAQAEQLFAGPTSKAAAAAKPGAKSIFLALLGCLSYGPSGGLLPLHASAADVQMTFAPEGSSFRAEAQRRTPARDYAFWNSGYFNFNIQANLTKNVSAYYLTRKVSGSYQGRGLETGLTYEHNFNRGHRPIYGRLGISYSMQRVGYDFGTFDNADEGLRVAGTKLNADKISVAVQEFTDGWLPRLGVGVEVTHRLAVAADAGWLLPWHTRSELHLAEESGFSLTRSEVDLPLPATGATVLVNNTPAAAPWSLGRPMFTLGIQYRLR